MCKFKCKDNTHANPYHYDNGYIIDRPYDLKYAMTINSRHFKSDSSSIQIEQEMRSVPFNIGKVG